MLDLKTLYNISSSVLAAKGISSYATECVPSVKVLPVIALPTAAEATLTEAL